MAERAFFKVLQKSSSPYINRFLSADTIVPDFANPQNLNRFSYVLNNPLKYTDPTGHKACEEYQGSCLSEKQVAKIKKTQAEKIKERSREKNRPQTGVIDEIVQIVSFSVEALDLLDLVEDGIQWGRPAYRQIKYAIPLGGVEWGVDAGLQLYDDRKINLTGWQRTARAGVRALESAAIDGLSTGVGLSAGAALQASIPVPIVSAGLGYIIGSYSTSAILDNFATQINPNLFSGLGLGGAQ